MAAVRPRERTTGSDFPTQRLRTDTVWTEAARPMEEFGSMRLTFGLVPQLEPSRVISGYPLPWSLFASDDRWEKKGNQPESDPKELRCTCRIL